MLAERKRYNYNIAGTSAVTASRSQKKLPLQSSINTPVLHLARDENPGKAGKRVYLCGHSGKNWRPRTSG